MKRNVDRVVIYDFDKSRVTKVTVVGDGPKPLVHRILVESPKDKDKK